VIEITRFRLKDGADEAAFLQADRRVQTEFAYQQPGLARRTTARHDDGEWIVIDVWRSGDDADECARRWDDDPIVAEFMALIDESSVVNRRFETLD
jgi:hypothetical protein